MAVYKFMARTAGLHNAVKNVQLAAAPKGQMTPVLEAANMVIRNGILVLEATDRYKLLQIKVDDLNEQIESRLDSDEELAVNANLGIIPVETLKNIEQSIRAEARSKQEPRVIVTVDTDEKMLTIESQMEFATQQYRLFDGEYPKIDSLFDGELSDEVAPMDYIALQHLQALAKVQHTRVSKNSQHVQVHGAPGSKPQRWYWTHEGETWGQGLLMPIKLPEEYEMLNRYF